MNPSDRMIERLRVKARGLSGWLEVGGRWERVRTPAGVASRGGVVVGRCSTSECRRTVTLDCRAWVERGLGDTPLDQAQATYRCGGLCRLAWREESYPRGLPILAHAQHPEAHVVVACRRCGFGRRIPIPDFLEGIIKAGTGHRNVAEVDLRPEMVRGRCRCGAREWRVALRPPNGVRSTVTGEIVGSNTP